MEKLSEEELEQERSKYTRKIEIPIYEPKNKKPHISELYDKDKCNYLIERIKKADIPDDIKEFLYSAAERHTKFNFSKVADFYAHSDFKIKKLFEESALVIIDYDDAIQNGFITYQKSVDEDLEDFLDCLTEEDYIKNKNKKKEQVKQVNEVKKLF